MLPSPEKVPRAYLDVILGHKTSGQSYKHFTLVNYDSRVVIWGIFQSGMTVES